MSQQIIETILVKRVHFSCPLCREKLAPTDINFVNKKSTVTQDPLPVELKVCYCMRVDYAVFVCTYGIHELQ